jgi:hypothetical protein
MPVPRNARAHHQRDELQRQRRHEPDEIGGARLDYGIVGGNRPHVAARQHASRDQRQQGACRRQAQRLIEYQIGIGPVLASHRLRNQGHGADAQNLRQRVDQEAGIAGGADACDSRVTQVRNKIQIDQPAQHHHDHAGENLRCHHRDVAHDRALG